MVSGLIEIFDLEFIATLDIQPLMFGKVLSACERNRPPPVGKALFPLILSIENVPETHDPHGKARIQLNRPPQQRNRIIRVLLVAQRLSCFKEKLQSFPA